MYCLFFILYVFTYAHTHVFPLSIIPTLFSSLLNPVGSCGYLAVHVKFSVEESCLPVLWCCLASSHFYTKLSISF